MYGRKMLIFHIFVRMPQLPSVAVPAIESLKRRRELTECGGVEVGEQLTASWIYVGALYG